MEIIINEIREKLQKLSFSKQMTYFYTIAKKLFPHYQLFSEKENYGNPDVLIAIQKYFETFNLNVEIEQEQPTKYKNALEKIVHHTEDFGGTMQSSFALDVCSFYYEVLEYIDDKDSEHFESLVELSIRPIETFLQNRDELPVNMRVNEINNYMIKQPMILKELAHQLELLNYLSRIKQVNQKVLQKIITEPADLELIPVEIEY